MACGHYIGAKCCECNPCRPFTQADLDAAVAKATKDLQWQLDEVLKQRDSDIALAVEQAVKEERECLNHMLDERCPDDIRRELFGIAEQCGKNQYLNAIGRALRLSDMVYRRFGAIIKGAAIGEAEKG